MCIHLPLYVDLTVHSCTCFVCLLSALIHLMWQLLSLWCLGYWKRLLQPNIELDNAFSPDIDQVYPKYV